MGKTEPQFLNFSSSGASAAVGLPAAVAVLAGVFAAL
uniref:Uncharacterized protein n=1 Tax=Arundo donax TaxID=35708 RepID=A0A0A8Z4A5_ARUDO